MMLIVCYNIVFFLMSFLDVKLLAICCLQYSFLYGRYIKGHSCDRSTWCWCSCKPEKISLCAVAAPASSSLNGMNSQPCQTFMQYLLFLIARATGVIKSIASIGIWKKDGWSWKVKDGLFPCCKFVVIVSSLKKNVSYGGHLMVPYAA